MKITTSTPGFENVIALDKFGNVIGYLSEIDTEKMEGYQIGYVRDRAASSHSPHRFFDPVPPGELHKHDLDELCRKVTPIPIHEILDRRTGAAWEPEEE